jgi:hypothetical protein
MNKYEILGARILIQARCRQAGVKPSKVMRRLPGYGKLTPLRASLATEIRGAGFSYPETGELLNRDHSTIIYLMNGWRK